MLPSQHSHTRETEEKKRERKKGSLGLVGDKVGDRAV